MRNEFRVQTPTGARVLVEIGCGFAFLRSGYAPPNSAMATERLTLSSAFDKIHVAADGTFLNSRHLFAVAIGLMKPGEARSIDDLSNALFFHRPDLHCALIKLFAAYDTADPYWKTMVNCGWYDPAARFIHRYTMK